MVHTNHMYRDTALYRKSRSIVTPKDDMWYTTTICIAISLLIGRHGSLVAGNRSRIPDLDVILLLYAIVPCQDGSRRRTCFLHRQVTPTTRRTGFEPSCVYSCPYNKSSLHTTKRVHTGCIHDTTSSAASTIRCSPMFHLNELDSSPRYNASIADSARKAYYDCLIMFILV